MAEQKSRFTKIVTFILFGFLVLSFGLWGIGDIFRGGGRITHVATVGDREIGVQAYELALRREIRRLQDSANNSLSREQLVALGVEQRALQPLIQQALIQSWAADMGLVVTEQQLLDQIAAEPAFQIDGRFSQQRYELALRDAGYSEQAFLDALSIDILRAHLVDPAKESATLPTSGAERLFAYLAETRVADYLLLPTESFVDLPEPTPEALQEVYEDFSSNFEAPEYRRVTLLHLTPELFSEEVEVDEARARAYFEENRDSYAKPELRSIQLVSYEQQADAEAALAEVQAGRTLEEVAADSGRSPTLLANQSREQLAAVLPDLEQAVFAQAVVEPYGVGESVLGWHLFELTGVLAAKEPNFEQARDQIVATLELQGAQEALDSIAAQVADELSSGATLPEVSEKLNLPLTQIEAIDRNGRDRSGQDIAGLPTPAQFLPEVFQGEIGLETLLVQAADMSWFAFRLDEIVPPAVRPFEEVADQVQELWARVERGRLAKAAAEALAERINGGSATLEDIAVERGSSVTTTEPLDRNETSKDVSPATGLAAALFGIEVGEAVTVDGDTGAVLAMLREVTSSDSTSEPDLFANLTTNLDRAVQSDLVGMMVRSLEQTYTVELNQQALDSINQTF